MTTPDLPLEFDFWHCRVCGEPAMFDHGGVTNVTVLHLGCVPRLSDPAVLAALIADVNAETGPVPA